jgi:aminoacylase
VEHEKWVHPAFEARELDNGDIVSRGTQDMKCVGIQYVEALRRLMARNEATFPRTIHVGFLPDEEIGGHDGICQLLASEWWKTLNVGVALDEGLANDGDSYNVYYAERSVWWVMVHATGQESSVRVCVYVCV